MPRHTSSKRLELLFQKEAWADARALIEGELGRLPPKAWMRHWWLTRLSTTYYEQREYPKSVEIAAAARGIAPKCPLVLWDLAGALSMTGEYEQALATYDSILARNMRALADGQCGEGWEWAKGLKTDCLFRAALCLRALGRFDEAAELMGLFVRLRHDAPESIYPAEKGLELLSTLAKSVPPKRADWNRPGGSRGRELLASGRIDA